MLLVFLLYLIHAIIMIYKWAKMIQPLGRPHWLNIKQRILKPDTRAGTGRSSFGVSSPGE